MYCDYHLAITFLWTAQHRKYNRYIYANEKQIAERRIYAGDIFPYTRDNTVLKTSDASGVDKSEMTLLGGV